MTWDTAVFNLNGFQLVSGLQLFQVSLSPTLFSKKLSEEKFMILSLFSYFLFLQLSFLKSPSLTFESLRARKELNKNCLAWFSYEYTLVWPCRVALIQQSPTAALIIRSHMLQIPRSFHYKQFSPQSLTLNSPASGPDVLLLLLFNIQEVDQKIIKLCDKWCDPNYLVPLWLWQHGQDEGEEQLIFWFEEWTF